MPETSVLPKAHCSYGLETCEPHNLIWTIEPCSAKGVNWSARTWVFAAEAIGLGFRRLLLGFISRMRAALPVTARIACGEFAGNQGNYAGKQAESA